MNSVSDSSPAIVSGDKTTSRSTLPLPSLPGKAEILPSNLLAPPLRIAKGLPHPKSLSYIGNLGELPIVIIAPSKFPNRKSLGSLSQSLTSWCTVSLSCATTFLCRLIGFGGDRHGSGVARFLVFYCEAGFFYFFIFLYAFLFRWDFGGQWAVGNGGVVGMVEVRWWWLGSGGAVIEVEGKGGENWEKKWKNIFYCVSILF